MQNDVSLSFNQFNVKHAAWYGVFIVLCVIWVDRFVEQLSWNSLYGHKPFIILTQHDRAQ